MILGLIACVESDALPFGSTSESCATCHPDQAEHWASSGHASSGTSLVFLSLHREVERSWGSFAAGSCDTCHTPGFGGDAAIGCVSCHAAVGNHGERDARLAIDLDQPLAGPLGVGQTAGHTSAQRELLTSESLCGTCHEVSGPELFVEQTLTEFRASPAAAEGRSCVACHAPAIEDGPITPDGPVRPRHDHRFVGFASAELLGEALSLRVDGDRDVVVTNEGAGHSVPTGVSFLRAIWVDFEADGVVADTPIWIGAVPYAEGEPVALVTDADEVRSAALAPGESARATLPGPGTAYLRARAYRPELVEALGLEVEVPTIEIASVWVE